MQNHTQPLMYRFKLYDQNIFKVESELKAKGIDYIETSQTGSDITFFLEGHPCYEKHRAANQL